MVLNAAIARCSLPKIFDWGTKTVYFQPQSGGAMDEKAFVGYIYFGEKFRFQSTSVSCRNSNGCLLICLFNWEMSVSLDCSVPPTLDPQRLDIGNIYDWFKNPLPTQVMPITWYPRNFTNPDIANRSDNQFTHTSSRF